MRSPMVRAAALAAMLLLTVSATTPVALAQASVEVEAVEYAFVGLPSSVPVGTSFRLNNTGEEDHEFLVVRRNEGTTETIEELLALPEGELFSKITFVGGVFAQTSQISPAILTIEEEGSYIAVCFVSQGTSTGPEAAPDAAAGASPDAAAASPGTVQESPDGAAEGPPGAGGPPHAFLGMYAEFTVGGPDSSPDPLSTPLAEGGVGASPEASPAG